MNKNGNKRVVVFCSDYITCLGLVRCLGEAGYRPECYYYGRGEYILRSRYISNGRLFQTIDEAFDFLLNSYPVYEERPILLTIPDPPAFYIDMHKDALERKFVLMSAGKQGGIAFWMDKTNIGNLAKKHGLNVPWTIRLSKDENIPENIEYPVFTKSIKSADGGKCDESICYSRNELVEKQKSILGDDFIVMKYVKKKKEINYFGLSVKGHVYVDFCDSRSRFPVGGYGHYNEFHIAERDATYHKIISMMRETGYEGLFDVEFLLGDDGALYFMEVNFRVDGEVYKLCEGINYPAEWCRLSTCSDDELPEKLSIKKKRFTGMTEIEDYRASVLTGQVSKIKWWWQFFTVDRRMLVNVRDPRPALSRLKGAVKRKISKVFKRI